MAVSSLFISPSKHPEVGGVAGLSDGECDGAREGHSVGAVVVGVTDGYNEGLTVGTVDGNLVGSGVGARTHVLAPASPSRTYPLPQLLQFVVVCVTQVVSSSFSPCSQTHSFCTQTSAPAPPDK